MPRISGVYPQFLAEISKGSTSKILSSRLSLGLVTQVVASTYVILSNTIVFIANVLTWWRMSGWTHMLTEDSSGVTRSLLSVRWGGAGYFDTKKKSNWIVSNVDVFTYKKYSFCMYQEILEGFHATSSDDPFSQSTSRWEVICIGTERRHMLYASSAKNFSVISDEINLFLPIVIRDDGRVVAM